MKAELRTPILLVLLALFACGGAGCPQLVQQYSQPLPRALPPNATREQVLEVVNTNSAQVQSLSSQRASLTVPGAPTLRATLAYERPRNFRLRAETGITGGELDLGSNDELFWFWVKRNQPPATYFCRHVDYAQSAARQVVPLPPEWFVQALGAVTFGPDEQHEGPFPVHGGRVEIRSRSLAPNGPTRITIVDDSRGVVLEQHVYDERGVRLASITMSRHARDAASGVVLPRHVELRWPATHFEMSLDFADLQVNALDPAGGQRWIKPLYAGYPDVDLARIGPAQLASPAASPASPPLQPAATPLPPVSGGVSPGP